MTSLNEPWALDAALRLQQHPVQEFGKDGKCAHALWYYHPNIHRKVCPDCHDIDFKDTWKV